MKINLPITQVERDYPADERLISETNLKGFVTSANASFCAVSGFAHEELVGKRHNIVRHPDVPPAIFADLWRTLKAGERWVGVIKNRCSNGDHYWVKAFVGPIVRNGEKIGYRSVRVKPTRAEIAEAGRLYKRINDGDESAIPNTLAELYRADGWGGNLAIGWQIGLLVGWPLGWMLAIVAAAFAGAGTPLLLTFLGLGATLPVLAAPAVLRRVREPMEQKRRLAMALEQGDLSARMHVQGRSDTARASRELNRALDGMELLISEMSQVFSGMARGSR